MSTQDIRAFHAVKATLHRVQAMHVAVILRPKDVCIHSAFEGDYDLLFDPKRFPEILAIAVTQCRHHGVSLIVDQSAPHKKRLFFLSDDPDERITVELWSRAELTIPSRWITPIAAIEWREACRFVVDDGSYLALRPDVSAAIYITHLYHKGKSLTSPEVQRRLSLYFHALNPSGAAADEELCSILDSLRSSRVDLKKANMDAYSALSRMGVQVKVWWMSPLLRRVQRRVARLAGRDGAALSPVPVIGPDGSGKTTIISALTERERLNAMKFKNVFRMSIMYRGYQFIMRELVRTEKAKSLVDEGILQVILTIALIRWWPVMLARMARVYRHERQSGIVLVDRYFWDYLLRLRDAEARPARVSGYALFSKFVPAPARVVVLCCSLDTIHSRKQELTASAIDYLYQLYCDQIARKRVGRVLMLSTDGPLERSYGQLARFLLPDRTARAAHTMAPRPSSGQAQAHGSATLIAAARRGGLRETAAERSSMGEGA